MATRTDDEWSRIIGQTPERWIEGCSRLMDASQGAATQWLSSRTAGIQCNLDTWSRLATCQQPGDAAAIQQQWWRDTTDRWGAELAAYQRLFGGVVRAAPADAPSPDAADPRKPQRAA
jgi:hypothetical protein